MRDKGAPLISVCIVCRNEADRIGPCLESVTWADEVVVMDLCSEDGSAEVARRYGARVVEREPLDHEGIRNHPRVLLTPHSAFYSVEAFNEMRVKGAKEARRVLFGEPVRNPVNLHALTKPRAVVR